MDCKDIKNLLPLYPDNGLQPNEDKEVTRHLANCAQCRQELQEYQKVWSLLGEVEKIEPSGDYISRFWTKVSLEKTWPQRFLEGVKDVFTVKKWSPVYVTAAIVLLLSAVTLPNVLHLSDKPTFIAQMDEEEIELVQNDLELAENLDIIANMDVLENYDIIEKLVPRKNS